MIWVVEECIEFEGVLAGFYDTGRAVKCKTVDYKAVEHKLQTELICCEN